MSDAEYDPSALRILAGMEPPPRRPAGHVEGRYPIEDGPGSSDRIELVVRVLLGTERSTVLVVDLVTGRALSSTVVPHGSEPGAAAAAVEAIVGKRLP
ncbi:hypothetical protein FV222_19820 [Methylobacterium sp. WL103]|uniref:hypothetical protein n=1 Tax=Methylobacterium sp. WL103 TaxID=2603891 RepID=UPI0011C83421|nr:hypothetical protein [Methylobacterium sp. WL103]TXM95843.1 hypothetical protein FV222_19820 [Methylobacterium sp. WL103]